MTTHLVLGSGNLAIDLCAAIEKVRGQGFVRLRCSDVDKWSAADFPKLDDMNVIWLATGARQNEARTDGTRSYLHNITLPKLLMDRAHPDTRLVFFSSLDCAHPEYPTRPHLRRDATMSISLWEQQKTTMESLIAARNRANTAYVRLSSLYGVHRPGLTFPGRLLRAQQDADALLGVPSNEVIPTPSEWAAGVLMGARNLWNPSGWTGHHLAPFGSVGGLDWAKLVFGTEIGWHGFLEKITWDHSRPRVHHGGSTLDGSAVHWTHLWQSTFRREDYQPIR